MNRRRCLFWLGFGLFGLSEKLRADYLDGLAAAAMRAGTSGAMPEPLPPPTHWRAAHNSNWRWYERETFTNGRWKLTGITTPVNRETGEPAVGKGYLDESLLPLHLRDLGKHDDVSEKDLSKLDFSQHRPSPERRSRHGRPPSKWLRSLQADELRIWLKTIDVPEAGVEGMTYFEHLTRDHSFAAKHVTDLTQDEQAKLHAAAHYGY